MNNLLIVTHTLGTSKWIDGCVDSVKNNLPEYCEHRVIVLDRSDNFIEARWDAFQSNEFVALVDEGRELLIAP